MAVKRRHASNRRLASSPAPAFDEQPAFVDLRDALSSQQRPVLAWTGAGLSCSAGLPSWGNLHALLRDRLEGELKRARAPDRRRALRENFREAQTARDFWEQFEALSLGLGQTEFRRAVVESLRAADRLPIPTAYSLLWDAGIRGMLTLNLDRFAARSLAACHGNRSGGALDVDDLGTPASEFWRAASPPSVIHLHGRCSNPASWVLTRSQLDGLLSDKRYCHYIDTIFRVCSLVFVGVTADDEAVSEHLSRLTRLRICLDGHFWVTHRDDQATFDFAGQHGVRLVQYQVMPSGSHDELIHLLAKLVRADRAAHVWRAAISRETLVSAGPKGMDLNDRVEPTVPTARTGMLRPFPPVRTRLRMGQRGPQLFVPDNDPIFHLRREDAVRQAADRRAPRQIDIGPGCEVFESHRHLSPDNRPTVYRVRVCDAGELRIEVDDGER